MISNDLFEETNEQQNFSLINHFKSILQLIVLNFLYIIFNEKSFNEKFLFTGNI